MKRAGKDERDGVVVDLGERNGLIVGLAALFRAAGIVRTDDEDARLQHRNTEAINQAVEFFNACESHGLITVVEEKE